MKSWGVLHLGCIDTLRDPAAGSCEAIQLLAHSFQSVDYSFCV